jgi:hypothetical protein
MKTEERKSDSLTYSGNLGYGKNEMEIDEN